MGPAPTCCSTTMRAGRLLRAVEESRDLKLTWTPFWCPVLGSLVLLLPLTYLHAGDHEFTTFRATKKVHDGHSPAPLPSLYIVDEQAISHSQPKKCWLRTSSCICWRRPARAVCRAAGFSDALRLRTTLSTASACRGIRHRRPTRRHRCPFRQALSAPRGAMPTPSTQSVATAKSATSRIANPTEGNPQLRRLLPLPPPPLQLVSKLLSKLLSELLSKLQLPEPRLLP